MPANAILVVDDDFQIQKLLGLALPRLGYTVLQALTGQEGLLLAESARPSLILLDLRMPEMDGHTFLRRLRSQGLATNVVVMSGSGDMEDAIEVLRLGAIDFLRKPWTPSDLATAVDRAVAFKQEEGSAARLLALRSDEEPRGATAPVVVAAAGNIEDGFAEVVQMLRDGKAPLQAVPPVVRDVRALIAHTDVSIEILAAVIARDESTAVEVMRLCNMPEFTNPHGRAADLRVAIQRSGVRRIGAMIETVFVSSLMREPRFRDLLFPLWRHSLARALAMRTVAEMLPDARHKPDSETAYVAGLLADLGVPVLLSALRERNVGGALPVDATLYAFVREHHERIGAMVLASWGCGLELIRIARSHHAATSSTPFDQFWMINVVAAEIAEELAPGSDATVVERHPPETVSHCIAALGLAGSSLEGLAQRLREEHATIVATLGAAN